MEIPIHISNKNAIVQGTPHIVCGNSDYTIRFAFDAEWESYTAKTARFAYCRDGKMLYQDVLFEGDTVTVPALYGIYEVAVGVYAGDIHTTTPARIPCQPCITDGDSVHEPPTPDVYDQLLEYLAQLSKGGTPIVNAMLLADGGIYGRICTAQVGVMGITLPDTVIALSGQPIEVTPTITPENASNKAVVWSTDSDLITIEGDTITAISPGTATLTATTVDGGYTASCTVNILDSAVFQAAHYATHGDMPLSRFSGDYFVIRLNVTKSAMSEVYIMDCRTEADWYINNRVGMANISQFVKAFTVNNIDMMDKITGYSINIDQYFVDGQNEILIELQQTYNPCILRHHAGGVGVTWMNDITIIYGEASQ